MSFFRRFLTLSMACLFSAAAHADVLYWMLDDPAESGNEGYLSAVLDTMQKASETGDDAITIIRLYADNRPVDPPRIDYDAILVEEDAWGGTLGTHIPGGDNGVYYLDLCVMDADGNVTVYYKTEIGYSYEMLDSIGAIQHYGAGVYDTPWTASMSPWVAASIIPEPTVGVLVMLGCAIVSLRRRIDD